MKDIKKKRSQTKSSELPPIPDKIYFTIGEVSQLCNLKQHVLRYWEQEFPQLSPAKRKGNRRYYQRNDVLTIREISSLLYEQGYTIDGARSKLAAEAQKSQGGDKSTRSYHAVKKTIADLEDILSELES